MRTFALFGAKSLAFLKLMVCSHGQGGGGGGGRIMFFDFIFCADVFYGRPLRNLFNNNSEKILCCICKHYIYILLFF